MKSILSRSALRDHGTLHMSHGVRISIATFVLFTGALPQAFQAVVHGMSGGVHFSFVLFMASAIVIDLLRLMPMFVLKDHSRGILHPLILVSLIWPLLAGVPLMIQSFFGYAGLAIGDPVSAPTYRALGWLPPGDVWLAMTKYNAVQILGILSFYVGYAFSSAKPGRRFTLNETPPRTLRSMMVTMIVMTFIGILFFFYIRGGLSSHLTELSGGRFRALAGLGPFIALFDIPLWACVIWIAARPGDAKQLLFIVALLAASVSQFLVSGSRSGTIFAMLLVGLAWSLRTQKIPWRLAILLLPIAFLSFGFLNIVRTAAWTGNTASEAAQSTNISKVLQSINDEFEVRRSIAGAVPVVEDGMRVSDGPLWGSSYLGGVFAFIPRSVWETKPRGPGSIYAVAFLGEEVEGTAVPIGPYAEAFWNFHLPGVIVLFLLYGYLLRRVSEFYMANPNQPFVLAFFVIFATQFGISTDNLVSFQQSLMVLLILLAPITVVKGKKQSRRYNRLVGIGSSLRSVP